MQVDEKMLSAEFNSGQNFLQVYKETLEETPGSHLIQKRRVAALKSQGNLTGAAEALNTYLDTFQADAEGWRELADIYIK
jgi:predicted Zn-dependent protease